MKTLAKLIVATTNLVEAEGRALRHSMLRIGIAFAAIAVSAVFVVMGFTLLMTALVSGLARAMDSTPGAQAVAGLLTLVVAGGLLWVVRQQRFP